MDTSIVLNNASHVKPLKNRTMKLDELISKLNRIKIRNQEKLNIEDDDFNPEIRIGEYSNNTSSVDGLYLENETIIIY